MIINLIKNKLDNNFLVHIDKLRDKPNIKNGLLEETTKKIRKRGDYGIASIDLSGSRILKEDGNLEKFSPVGEQQNMFGFDAMWCVSENGVCNQIETVINFLITLEDTESKEIIKVFKAFGLIKGDKCLLDSAYVAVGSGTTKRGNSYYRVANFVRKYGLIPKGMFPNYNKWKKWNELYYGKGVYINGNKVPQELLNRGKKLLEYIDFSYSWYEKDSKKANQKGCPGTSIGAWSYPDKNNIYRPVGIPNNHAVNRPKPVDKYRTIKDSYNPFTKLVSLDYPVGYDFLMSIRLKKKIEDFNFEAIKNLKKRGLRYVLLVNNCNEYTPGVYELLDGKLKKVEGDSAIDKWIQEQANKNILTGIDPNDFKNLVNII